MSRSPKCVKSSSAVRLETSPPPPPVLAMRPPVQQFPLFAEVGRCPLPSPPEFLLQLSLSSPLSPCYLFFLFLPRLGANRQQTQTATATATEAKVVEERGRKKGRHGKAAAASSPPLLAPHHHASFSSLPLLLLFTVPVVAGQ